MFLLTGSVHHRKAGKKKRIRDFQETQNFHRHSINLRTCTQEVAHADGKSSQKIYDVTSLMVEITDSAKNQLLQMSPIYKFSFVLRLLLPLLKQT